MNKSILLPLALPLLAGCGSVGAFVPPQTVANPANLNGARLTTSSVLQLQTVTGAVQYDTASSTPPGSFADVQYPSDVPFGMRPHAAKLSVRFTTASVSGPCLAPDSFSVTVNSFSASLWDSSNKAGAATLSGTPKVTLKATRTGSDASQTTYALSDNSVSASADQTTTDRAINILTAGGQNDANASAQISADNDALAGCNLSFTLGNTSVTLSNFH